MLLFEILALCGSWNDLSGPFTVTRDDCR